MDEDRITGTARNLGGKVEEGVESCCGRCEDASSRNGRPSHRRRAGLIRSSADTAADAAVATREALSRR